MVSASVMNKAAAKSWLKIYRVIDCIGALFNPNTMALATKILDPLPRYFPSRSFQHRRDAPSQLWFSGPGIDSFAGHRISRARIP
jgi:hypothetical protein